MSGSKGVHRWVRSGFVAGGLLLAPAFELGFGETRHETAGVPVKPVGISVQTPLIGTPVAELYRPMCGFCVEI